MLHRQEPVLTTAEQLAAGREVLQHEAAALASVVDRIDASFLAAVDMILSCRGHVIVTGIGKAGLVGQKIAATLASTGTPAHYLHPADAMHGDLGRVTSHDLILGLSHSGESAEMVRLLGPISDIGATLIAITSRVQSSLARAAQVVLNYGDVKEACPIGMAPSTSCVVMMGLGDALAFVLMKLRRFGRQDFSRFHPGGSLGRKLQPIDQVMRTGDRLRIADSMLTVREAFVREQRPGRRTGAMMLVDAAGRLVGIFTDSDLARLLEKRDLQALDRPMNEVMGRRPITLRLGQRVGDALTLLRDHQVSEVPVLDADGRPVGLVDITDLVDLLPDAA